jgi:hypothetical protein
MIKQMSDLEQGDVPAMWHIGYRPYEVYMYNSEPEKYYGARVEAGTISGWTIEHIFAIEDELKNYPFFDCIILGSDVASCETYWIE